MPLEAGGNEHLESLLTHPQSNDGPDDIGTPVGSHKRVQNQR